MKLVCLIFCLGALCACNSGSDAAPPTPDHLRSLTDPRSSFTQNKQEMNFSSLGTEELDVLLNCDLPSTTRRLDAEDYSAHYQVVDRFQEDFESPIVVKHTGHVYKTSNFGKTYSSGEQLISHTINGESAIATNTYSYEDVCTASTGCDPDKRVFTSGSHWSLVRSQSAFNKAYYEATKLNEIIECSFHTDPDAQKIPAIVQEGLFTLGEQSYQAVQLTHRENVLITCMGFKVGKGTRVDREIVIADLLVNTDQFTSSSLGQKNISCPRTKTFSGWHVLDEQGQLIRGQSNELAYFEINGDVQSIEDWKSSQEDIQKTLDTLEAAVARAQSVYNDAKSTYASAQAETSNKNAHANQAKAEAEQALSEANSINADPESTPKQKEAANKKYLTKQAYASNIQKSYELAVEAERDALRAMQVSETNLENARRELNNFKQKHL